MFCLCIDSLLLGNLCTHAIQIIWPSSSSLEHTHAGTWNHVNKLSSHFTRTPMFSCACLGCCSSIEPFYNHNGIVWTSCRPEEDSSYFLPTVTVCQAFSHHCVVLRYISGVSLVINRLSMGWWTWKGLFCITITLLISVENSSLLLAKDIFFKSGVSRWNSQMIEPSWPPIMVRKWFFTI